MAAQVISLLASLLAPIVAGRLLVAGLGRGERGGALLAWGLALPLGAGLCASFFFLWGCVFGIDRWSVVGGDAALLVGLALLFGVRAPTPRPEIASQAAPTGWRRRVQVALTSLAALAVAVSLFVFVARCVTHPDGNFDAIGIWNMRATFLSVAWGEWDLVFLHEFLAHVDYPLLLPALVTRSWVYCGGDHTVLAPMLWAGVFTFATVAVLFGCLRALRGPIAAGLAVIALLGVPFFVVHGASQAGDVPLACYALCAVAAVVRYRDGIERAGGGGRGQRRWLVVAGAALGCAVWTKNDALPFAALLAVLLVASLRPRAAGILALLRGGLLPTAALLVFKLFLGGPNDLLESLGDGRLGERVLDAARYARIGEAMLEKMAFLDPRGLDLHDLRPGSGFLPLAVCVALAGRARGRAVPWVALLSLTGAALAFYLVYAWVSPYDLDWHIRTAMVRLLLQLWPAAVLACFCFVRVPDGDRH